MRFFIADEAWLARENIGAFWQTADSHSHVIEADSYQEAMGALGQYVGGVFLVPADENKTNASPPLAVRCFGNFEVFYQGIPLVFKRTKAKEVLAYLICLRGAMASAAEIAGALWEDDCSGKDYQSYFRQAFAELKRVLATYHCENILIHHRNTYAVDIHGVDCDWYRFLNDECRSNGILYLSQTGFMLQYSWAEVYHFD